MRLTPLWSNVSIKVKIFKSSENIFNLGITIFCFDHPSHPEPLKTYSKPFRIYSKQLLRATLSLRGAYLGTPWATQNFSESTPSLPLATLGVCKKLEYIFSHFILF